MKIEVKLKQHTPIIHFQHNQAGASLRATELKPKIDRFVLNDLKQVDEELYGKYQTVIKKNFSESRAPSRYKVCVKANRRSGNFIKYATLISKRDLESLKREKNIDPKFPAPYFGDCLAVSHEDVKAEIFSFDHELAKFLERILPYVLVFNNFGSRQGKGFGCFLPLNMDNNRLEEIICLKYKTFWTTNGRNCPFKVIQKTCQLLKGGVNIPRGSNSGVYNKSELFNYMCQKKIRWEKHKIKSELSNNHKDVFDSLLANHIPNRIADCPKSDNNMQHRYIRAMLGLAEHNEYMVKKHKNKGIEKVQILIKDKKGEIKRFRSPVTFKVMNDKIYILPEVIGKDMFNREFEFILKVEKSSGSSSRTPLFDLRTPLDTFNLADFLKESLPNIKGHNWQIKRC